VVPPFSIRWIRPKEMIEGIWQEGRLLADKVSVVFKAPGKEVGRRLLQEIWVMVACESWVELKITCGPGAHPLS
jgi:hypothetical protein